MNRLPLRYGRSNSATIWLQRTHSASLLVISSCCSALLTSIRWGGGVPRVVLIAADSQYVCRMHPCRRHNELSQWIARGLAVLAVDPSSASLLVTHQWLPTGATLPGSCTTFCAARLPHARNLGGLLEYVTQSKERSYFCLRCWALKIFDRIAC